MNEEDVFSRLIDAIQMLKEKDAYLITARVHERTISSRLALYVQALFPTYHVDVEYNRVGLETKRLPRECQEREQDRVFPDIIVHRRGVTDDNILVIELKKAETDEFDLCEEQKVFDLCDEQKVRLFIKGEFKYRFGALVVVVCGTDGKFDVCVKRVNSTGSAS